MDTFPHFMPPSNPTQPPPPAPRLPPPHPIPPPPPYSPDDNGGGPTVIVVVFVSFGCVFFIALCLFALCCMIKKRKKEDVQEKDVIRTDKHVRVKEAIVEGPCGPEAVVLSVEEDKHIEEGIIRNEKMEKGKHYLHNSDPDIEQNHHSAQDKH